MKKLLTVAASFIVCLAAMAQGTVNFSNNGSTLISFASTADVPAALQGLAIGSAGGPANANWHVSLLLNGTDVLSTKDGLTVAGRWLGGVVTVPGIDAANPATFKIAAWSGTAASYAAALASGDASVYAGMSGDVNVTLGGGLNPAASLTATGTGFTGFTVAPVPEPSIIALGLLGGAAMLIRRRK